MEEPWNKTPFYMTYPLQNLFQAEVDYEKDLERMREMYPNKVKKLMKLIEDRCDELEYEGSRIYDENPDCRMLREEVEKLYERVKALSADMDWQEKDAFEDEPEDALENVIEEALEKHDIEADNLSSMSVESRFAFYPPEGFVPPGFGREGRCEKNRCEHVRPIERRNCDGWLCELTGVLFADEIYRRRARYRRGRRFW